MTFRELPVKSADHAVNGREARLTATKPGWILRGLSSNRSLAPLKNPLPRDRESSAGGWRVSTLSVRTAAVCRLTPMRPSATILSPRQSMSRSASGTHDRSRSQRQDLLVRQRVCRQFAKYRYLADQHHILHRRYSRSHCAEQRPIILLRNIHEGTAIVLRPRAEPADNRGGNSKLSRRALPTRGPSQPWSSSKPSRTRL